MNQPSLLNQFGQFWAARDRRTRALLAAATAALALGLFYALLIAPALTGRDRLHKNLPELRQQVAQLQVLAREAAAFSGKSAPPLAALSEESIRNTLAGKGLKPQSVILAGDVAKVQLASASFAGTLEWLEEMQKTAGLLVVDAKIAALAQPDLVNAVLTLRQQRNE